MSNYTKSTNFATKDNLPTGDPLKIVKGTEIDTEFNNIATAISTKTDNASAAITGGSITGITDLAIADGGTGASTATAALNNLLPSQTSNANKYLQTDGTNASWDAVSLSTADITGTLPIANGGTGTTSTTFVNLASNVTGTLPVANGGTGVTSSTGTGNVVLSNSPTLVTPALGTPASGVATNLTGLPLSTGITGLGTGVATALAINTPNTGAIVVNGGALGTPSSGVVTNLTGTANININGQVGSSTPNSGNFTTLSASSTVNISGGTVDGVAYLDASKNLTTGSVLSFSGVHLTSNRNKDTTYSGTDYTTYPNGFILQNSATPATGLFNSIYFKNNANMQNVFGVVQNSSGYGDFVWAGNSGSYAEWMRLSSSGLTLTSNPTLSGGTANGVTYLNGSKVLTSGSALTFDGATLGSTALSAAGSTVSYNLLTLKDTGTTYSASNWFTAFNNSTNATVGALYHPEIQSLGISATSALVFGIGSTPSEQMRLTSTGLGIGTSSPAFKLDLNGVGAVRAGNAIRYYRTDNAIYTELYDAGSSGFTLNNANGNGFRFQSAGSTQATLDSAGNLGLGVTPSAWSLYKAFQNGATSVADYASGNNSIFGSGLYYGGSPTDFRYISTGQRATSYRQVDGAHTWNTTGTTTGTAGGVASLTQAMTLDASGNLALGQTSSSSTDRLTVSISSSSTSNPLGSAPTNIKLINTSNTAGNGSYITNAYSNANQNAYIGFVNVDQNYASAIVFATATSGASNYGERARIDSSGNLGLGVTPSNAYTNSRSFELGANGIIWAENASSIYNSFILGLNFYYSAGGDAKYKATGVAASRYVQYQGQHQWMTAASGTAGNNISFTQAMTLDASGNLGVGTTSPNFSGFGSSTGGIQVTNSTNAAFRLNGNAGGDFYLVSGSGQHWLYATGAIPMTFSTNGTERVRIDSSGNLLVGTTTSNSAKLTIANAGAEVFQFFPGIASNDNQTLHYNRSTAVYCTSSVYAADHRFYIQGNEKARIDSSGNLLVGTTTAKDALTVYNGISMIGGGAGNSENYSGTDTRTWASSYVASGGTQTLCRIASPNGSYTGGGLVRVTTSYQYRGGNPGNNYAQYIVTTNTTAAANLIYSAGTYPTITVTTVGSGSTATLDVIVNYSGDSHVQVVVEVFGKVVSWSI